MIQCNLRNILKARKIYISELSKKTGLSRTTITSLANRPGGSFNLDTIEKVCNALNISLYELFTESAGADVKTNQKPGVATVKIDDKSLQRFDAELEDKTWTVIRDNPSLYAGIIAQKFERDIHEAMLAGQDNTKNVNHALSYSPIRKEVIGLLSKQGYVIDYDGLVQTPHGVVQGFIQARWRRAEPFQGGGYYEKNANR